MGHRADSFVVPLILLCILSGCINRASPSLRLLNAEQSAKQHNWQREQLNTAPFDLVSFIPKSVTKRPLLTVYIEGDGLAWLTKNTISSDPTPSNPIGLKLALRHPTGNASYLARPCQYVGGITARNCNKHDWTDSRFSKEVIESTSEALDSLKAQFGAKELQLVGFSGGAAVAALLAAQRDDVVKLITVAGNLNHQAWTNYHAISPLTGSLNPADFQTQLTQIEQVHFVGAEDTIIPPHLTQQFVATLPTNKMASVVVVPNQTHHCCWDKVWTELMLEHSN